MNNIEQTIISQYGNSSTISALVHNMNDYIDPSADIDQFFSFIWDVSQAQGFGLDIWGRIVNVSRTVLTNPVYYLEDEPYRALIMVKALSNISASTAPSINQLLSNWMKARGRAYVTDPGGMNLIYVFEFFLQAFELTILEEANIFLRPAGVGTKVIATEFPVFGFSEMGTAWAAPFDQAPFIAEV